MDKPTYYYIDESGDLALFNKKKRKLNLQTNGVTSIFYLGLVKINDPQQLNSKLDGLRNYFRENELYRHLANLEESLKFFHAKDDMYPIKIKVFETLKQLDFSTHVIFRRKDAMQIEKSADFSITSEYHSMISRLLRDRLHKNNNIIVFSRRGDTINDRSLKDAIEKAKNNFTKKHKQSSIFTTSHFIGEPLNHNGLQVIDYVLWAINRFLTKKEDGYIDAIKDKIKLIVDMDDKRTKGYGEFYNSVEKFKKNVLSHYVK